MATKSPRAAVYLRISADREGRELGVQRQEQDCRKLAKRLGFTIAEVFTENDISASSRSKKHRPLFEEMLARSEAGAFDAIIAYSNSRLTRRPAEWERLIRLYEARRVVIHTITSGSADLSKADGRAIARTIAAWDAAEAERTTERVQRDVVRRAEEGVFHGGSRSFGWKDPRTIDEAERQIMENCADRLLAGESLRGVAADLNHRGVKTVTGAQWSPTVVRQMLVNPRVAGWRTHNDEIVGRAEWPAALDEAKWQQLVALLTDPGRDSGSRVQVNLLPGLARCGECDRTLSTVYSSSKTHGKRRKYVCKPCRLYRDMRPVDVFVTAAIIRMLEEYEDEPAHTDPAVVQTIERLRKKIKATKLEFTDDDTVTPQELREMLRHLRGRFEAEEAKLVRSRKHQVVDGVTGEHAAAAWELLTLSRRRAIIGALVDIRLHRAKPGRNAFNPETVEITER